MSGWSDSEDCPMCSSKDSLKTFGDNKPMDTVSGFCLECGYTYTTGEDQAELEEVNEQRKVYNLEPLTKLKEQM